jgi:hypothetical protein
MLIEHILILFLYIVNVDVPFTQWIQAYLVINVITYLVINVITNNYRILKTENNTKIMPYWHLTNYKKLLAKYISNIFEEWLYVYMYIITKNNYEDIDS